MMADSDGPNFGNRRQGWLGLIATLICIVIIFAMLAPAVQHTRHTRTECSNRLKNIALAAINFETSKKIYPGYQSQFGAQGDQAAKWGSWTVAILTYIEQQELRDLWDDPSEQSNWTKAVVQQACANWRRNFGKLKPQFRMIVHGPKPMNGLVEAIGYFLFAALRM